jgi:hypothetical protein
MLMVAVGFAARGLSHCQRDDGRHNRSAVPIATSSHYPRLEVIGKHHHSVCFNFMPALLASRNWRI